MNDVIAYLDSVEDSYGTLLIDDVIPSLYSYKAIALYNGLKVEEAEKMLKIAVHHYPNDTRSWINLGEMQVQTFKLDEAYQSFSAALKAGDQAALPRALRTKGWATSWQDFESLSYSLERGVSTCLKSMEDCRVDSAGGLEYCDVDGRAHVLMNALNPNSMLAANTLVPPASVASLWLEAPKSAQKNIASGENEARRLKVGFMSADFGVHPVAQLVRGLFQMVNTSRIEVFCFSLQPKMSWWGQNISETVEHFVWLQNMNTFDAAREIARLGVEVLIDLNGHTMHSGLTIMAHRPSPVQMSFLGLPSTTAASFVDYYIADSVAVPPEQSKQYSEQLLLMSDCYIANDYAQIQGDVLRFNGEHRAPRSALGGDVDLTKATFLFATLSNSQKMDPEIFHVWMNILRRFAGSKMVITEHAGKNVYVPHLQARARGFGVRTDRLVPLKQVPWIDHLYGKTAIDLVLDTIAKNGHTTGLDGIWAGIPTLSLAGGQEAPRRAAESIAVTLDSTLGLAYSLKEYEDLAFALARKNRSKFVRERAERRKKATKTSSASALASTVGPSEEENALLHSGGKFKKSSGLSASTGERLRLWRKHLGSQRTISNLFDMPQYEETFSRLLQGSWELVHVAENKQAFRNTAARGLTPSKKKGFVLNNVAFNSKGLFHMFTPVSDRYRQDHDTSSGGRANQQRPSDGSLVLSEEPARRWNRDSRGRIVVAQTTESAGSMIGEAVERLPSGEEARDAPTSHHKFDKIKKRARKPPSTAASTAAEVQTEPAKRNARVEQRSGGRAAKQYPPLPSYIFDGRLVMLNIGQYLLLFSSLFFPFCRCVLALDVLHVLFLQVGRTRRRAG